MNHFTLYEYFLIGAMGFLAILIVVAIIRSIKGPRVADRIIAVNMIGTLAIALIALLALLLKEEYLFDVCLIYALISFLAVVILSKVYRAIHHRRAVQDAESEAELRPEDRTEKNGEAQK